VVASFGANDPIVPGGTAAALTPNLETI